MPRISPFLWFDHHAEAAANHYVSIFPNSRILNIARHKDARPGHEATQVVVVRFELDGLKVTALDGGPLYKFSEAMSFSVDCKTQDEVDHYWSRLTVGGEEGPCGWLKDKFGFSWQVTPSVLGQLLGDADRAKAGKAMQAMLKMKKIVIADLKQAFES